MKVSDEEWLFTEEDCFWHRDNSDMRIEMTASVWDKWADEWFTQRGWTKDCHGYETDWGTGTLWVLTSIGESNFNAEYKVGEDLWWEDTRIPSKEADRLLTEGWDYAEAQAEEMYACDCIDCCQHPSCAKTGICVAHCDECSGGCVEVVA